ncbi:hypothetical protein [Micromonospora musae]|uniref:hypothetical protein n=1 Tax=Micromonospora musae TaxID=1894970 RepID=UPI001F1D1D7E|nr:hypothetical protein [Micromonospora musae]
MPGATHTDPGPNWNWTYYLRLVDGVTGIGTGPVNTESANLNVRSGPTNVWNRIGTNRWVSDAYVSTGHNGYIPGLPRC